MKIYFIASSDVNDTILKKYENILNLIRAQGNHVGTSVCFDKSLKMDPFCNIYESITKNIEEADIIVADISYPSGGVGFQIYHAIEKKKPTLIIYSEDHGSNPSVVIRGIQSPKVLIYKYSNTNELSLHFPKLLEKCQKMIKVRFNLVLTNRELSFLNKYANSHKVSTTKLIRSLINNFIKVNE